MRLKFLTRKGDGHEVGNETSTQRIGWIEEVLCLVPDARADARTLNERAGNNGVRHPCRRTGGNRHLGNHGFPATLAGTLERDCRGDKRALALLGVLLAPREHTQMPTAGHTGVCRSDPLLRHAARQGPSWQVRGQSTVEFAVVMAGFMSLTVALATLWHAFDSGLILNHVLAVASHHIQTVAPVTITDIFLY